jgi:hypothetical protein
MKQLLILISAALVSSLGFAGPASNGLNKGSNQLKALNSALHSYHSIQPTLDKNDIEMGSYGGEDISHSHSINGGLAIA